MKNYTHYGFPLLTVFLISAFLISAMPGTPDGYNLGNICLADTFLGGVPVSGVWDASAGNFLIWDSIWVASGTTLTINAGVDVKFAQNCNGLTVYGTLIVNGVQGDSVYFTSSMPFPLAGDWGRVMFSGSSANGGNIRYCVFQYADKGARLENCSPHFAHCSFCHNSEHGILVNNSNFILDSSYVGYNGFSGGGYSGININDSAPHLRGTVSEHNSNCGLVLQGTYGGEVEYGGFSYNDNSGVLLDLQCYGTEIAYNQISYNDDYGVHIDNCSSSYVQLNFHHNLIYHNILDGYYIDSSELQIVNNTIVFNERDGIYAYNSDIDIYNNIIASNDHRGIYLQNSNPIINYNDVWDNSTADYLGCGPGAEDTSANPQFVNYLIDDYHLEEFSPCIDIGSPLSIYNDPDGTRNDMGALYFDQSAVEPWENSHPRTHILLSNYPNPFNERTSIVYDFSGVNPAPDELKIYDIAGRLVINLSVQSNRSGVTHWDGRDIGGGKVSSGIYYCFAGNRTIKMIMLK